MTSIRIFSDLHIEFGKKVIDDCIKICSKMKTKYIILAGDITDFENREEILTELVNKLRPYTDNIIYILGNHEYYKKGKSTNIVEIYREICTRLGIYFLENEYLETDDYVFYGTTLWSKLNDTAFNAMNDKYSFNKKQDIIDLHEHSVSNLEIFITNYNNNKPLVIITHYLPSFQLIDVQYKKYRSMNTGFATDLERLIKDPVKYWIYGHTHKPSISMINGVELFCNPAGYPDEGNILDDCLIE